MTASDVVTIISACSVALVAIIGAWRTGEKVKILTNSTEHSADVAGKKLDAIHTLTNSNLTAVKTDLTIANDRIAKLEALLNQFVEETRSDTKETTKGKTIDEKVEKILNK